MCQFVVLVFKRGDLIPSCCFQVPFYKGEHITFDVEPEKLDFEVMHDSVLFEVSMVTVVCVCVCVCV